MGLMLVHVLISTSVFLALLLFALWALRGTATPVEGRIRGLARAGWLDPDLSSVPFRERVILPVVESVGRRAVSVLPGGLVGRMEQRLVLAGQRMRGTTFCALVLAAGALLAGAYLVLVILVTHGVPSATSLVPAPLFGALGASLPIFLLLSKARERKSHMLRTLPDSMDLLTISVEAGLSLDGAFHQVAEKQPGPLADEIRQMLREIALGKTRRQALLDLADRTEIDDVGTFVNAVIQAEQLGSSLAPVLRVQTQRLRVRRRQRAEQEARRAPVKIVFPLVFCLMPSLFIFILGPFVVSIVDFLSSS
jgi:tight adherence protein C